MSPRNPDFSLTGFSADPPPRRKASASSKSASATSRERPTMCPAFGSSARAHNAPARRLTANRPVMVLVRNSRSLPPVKRSRHAPRCFRRQRRVVDVALVDDERNHSLRLPAGKFVVELAAGRHAPQQERYGGELGVLRS